MDYNQIMIYQIFFLLITVATTFLITRVIYIRQIKKLTIKDKKTGIYTRSYFDSVYITEFQRARRINHPISIIFIKCDSSTELIGELIHSIQRDTDFIAKYDKEHYVAVLYDTDSNGTDKVISRIISNLPEGRTVNMGIHACIPDSHISSQYLLDESKNALIKSLKHGKNMVEFSLDSI